MKDGNHIKVIDIMRGIAALAVTVCHVGGATIAYMPNLSLVLGYGQLGVHVFFVISGIVMPWSLQKINYTVKDFGKFIARRSIRIDPPYYLTIILTLLATFLLSLRPGYAGLPFVFEYKRFLLHLGYLIPISDYNWYNNIFWTLSIEFQYYLLIGLIFPLISKNRIAIFIFLALFAVFPFLITLPKSDLFIFDYQGLFAMGIIAWIYKKAFLRPALCHALVLLEFILVWHQLHIPAALAGLLSYILITQVDYRGNFLPWLGKISYSLYLTHPLILIAIGGILRRTPENNMIRIIILIGVTAFSIVFAHYFWRFVELPSQSLAKRMFPHKTETD